MLKGHTYPTRRQFYTYKLYNTIVKMPILFFPLLLKILPHSFVNNSQPNVHKTNTLPLFTIFL